MDIASNPETSGLSSGQNPEPNDLVQGSESQVAVETQGNDETSGQGKSGLSESLNSAMRNEFPN